MKRITTALIAALCGIAITGCTPAIAEQPSDSPRNYEFRDISDYFEPRDPEGATRIVDEQAQKAQQSQQEAAEQAAAPEAEYEPAWEDYGAYTRSYNSYGNSFMSDGVAYIGETEFSWYSQNDLPGGGLTELNANGRHVNDDGLVVDGDGYIAVASPWGKDEIGTVVDTPFGQGKVYDVNEGDAYDLYTDF